ncbi:Electron transfer flavoprotein small subunit [Candidatus Hodgkinia cicadicola]|nr:Electron transfer flavoprotein small subunit [Candidatus Hodgkinia cicadicola]
MRVLVTTKIVSEPDVAPSVSSVGIQTADIKRVIEPSDEANLRMAASLKRANSVVKITAACVSAIADRNVFKRVLLLGADDAVLIKRVSLGSLETAALIRRLITLESYELVLLSNSSSDNGSGQTAPALASLLGWPHLSNVAKLVWANGQLRVLCLLDRGFAWFEIDLPCVIACNAKTTEPRLSSLSELIEAKLKRVRLKSLDIRSVSPKLTAFNYTAAVPARNCKIVIGVANALETTLECLRLMC